MATKSATKSRVKVKKSKRPRTDKVPETAQWVEVTIALDPEQKAELKKLGINASSIKIRTFDIERLGGIGPVAN